MSYILLIENNLDTASMMIRLLEAEGYEVRHAERGLDGVKIANQHRPLLVLMDFNLPDIDGRVLILSLKKQLGGESSPPFIGVTARTGVYEPTTAARFGADAFIRKPFDPQEFVDTVNRYARPPQG